VCWQRSGRAGNVIEHFSGPLHGGRYQVPSCQIVGIIMTHWHYYDDSGMFRFSIRKFDKFILKICTYTFETASSLERMMGGMEDGGWNGG
jgi:hypothetical protein